ncbi:thiamine pyrophosphate-binding protein (plasmid) [Deinococcus sp. KNUC1210]|uniref:thiamine pyrophosphate-binding protein n=1 Tax=Deinococcus sp. KNUC1210 TaxID=2917691 RepID=UPI001EF15CC1|nr:thiamine pyrophosphate-binding protein [Deinococcus sp. KNUC1210]ULH17768.1 thiamine pyrophosphate-binding protein [Deinococcus sp. KNUC1210]
MLSERPAQVSGPAAGKTGRQLIIEQFLADGLPYMFGNPGTVEQGFLDSLEEYPEFKYILTLQESIAVGMADGYARASGGPALVQLHSGVGLGNGIGMMYQAMRGHAPLVVIAGESGVQYDAMDAQMAADLVAMARPVTKYSTRVVHASSLLRVIRRAIKIATTAPMGPVFVSLPMDVLDTVIEEQVHPATRVRTRVRPDDEALHEAAALLASATRPLILMGDGVTFSGAQTELQQVAERLGAPVWGVNNSEINMLASHPLYQGNTGHMFGADSIRAVQDHDCVLVVGTYVFPEVFPALSGAFADGTSIVHIDLNAYEIAKNHPVDVALLGDPKTTLAALLNALEPLQDGPAHEAAQARSTSIGAAKQQARETAIAADDAHAQTEVEQGTPLQMASFMRELAKHLPADALVFDEALTNSPPITRYLPDLGPGQFFQTRGGSLGVGIPGALGLQLAHPEKVVVGFTGDGGGMYTIQALWTAAHHQIPAKFVVCNNRSYKLLKLNIEQYWSERDVPQHAFPKSFDLYPPFIRFDEMAHSMGVASELVERPEQIAPAIERMLSHQGPYLIDLVIGEGL